MFIMGTIISVNHLKNILPSGVLDTNNVLTDSVLQASNYTNTWAERYLPFDEVDSNQNAQSPGIVVYFCKMIAKAIYYQSIGQIFRDGSEGKTWQDELDYYKKALIEMDIEPSLHSKTIVLNSDGMMLIERNREILPCHPQCKIISSASPQNQWNQYEHWAIRKGKKYEGEYADGWYFDGATYKSSIEGILYYLRSYRNDKRDYMKYSSNQKKGMDE